MKSANGNNFISLIFLIIIPLINLVFSNIYVPNLLTAGELSNWRLFSILIAFSGFFHLGIADGFYKNWLRRENNDINVIDFFRIFFIILLISTIITYLFEYHFKIYVVPLWAIIFTLVLTSLTSFSNYYCQIFLNGGVLNLALSLQSVVFLFGLFVLNNLKLINETNMVLLYGFSCLPINYLSISRKMISIKPSSITIADNIYNGFPLVVSNIAIIIFMNFDKILARHYLIHEKSFAAYTLESSIFVAGASLGSTTGGFLVSKSLFSYNRKYRLLCLLVFLLVINLFTSPLSHLLNNLVSKYENNYASSIICGTLSFYVFAVYVSVSKVFYPKMLISLLYLFPILFIFLARLLVNDLNLSFDTASFNVITWFLLLMIFTHESGKFVKEKE